MLKIFLANIGYEKETIGDTYIARKVWKVDAKQNSNTLNFFVDVETGEIIGGRGSR